MAKIYENWERLVDATLRREELRRIALRTPSDVSSVFAASSFNSSVLEGASRVEEETFAEGGEILASVDLRIFSLSELKIATSNFAPRTLLGSNEFGMLHTGSLCNKDSSVRTNESLIVLRRLCPESVQGFHEWQSEVNLIGRLKHPNIIQLLGYCREGKERLLVYEFLQQGSLEKHLFGTGNANHLLSWDRRLKILIGAARGLAFLHTSERQGLFSQKGNREGFYLCFDTSDILLDHSYNAKITGFNLAKIAKVFPYQLGITVYLSSHWTRTRSRATPAYMSTGNLYLEDDVYGFGIVVVEILTGLQLKVRNVEYQSKQFLPVDIVKPYLATKKRLDQILDSRLEGKYPAEVVLKVSKLALRCLEPQPKLRPSIQEVAEALESFQSSDENE